MDKGSRQAGAEDQLTDVDKAVLSEWRRIGVRQLRKKERLKRFDHAADIIRETFKDGDDLTP